MPALYLLVEVPVDSPSLVTQESYPNRVAETHLWMQTGAVPCGVLCNLPGSSSARHHSYSTAGVSPSWSTHPALLLQPGPQVSPGPCIPVFSG